MLCTVFISKAILRSENNVVLVKKQFKSFEHYFSKIRLKLDNKEIGL